jgi:hypothetical protein
MRKIAQNEERAEERKEGLFLYPTTKLTYIISSHILDLSLHLSYSHVPSLRKAVLHKVIK